MKIWVDTPTGTWGCVEDLVIVDVNAEEVDELDEMPDYVRADFAEGHPSAHKLT